MVTITKVTISLDKTSVNVGEPINVKVTAYFDHTPTHDEASNYDLGLAIALDRKSNIIYRTQVPMYMANPQSNVLSVTINSAGTHIIYGGVALIKKSHPTPVPT